MKLTLQQLILKSLFGPLYEELIFAVTLQETVCALYSVLRSDRMIKLLRYTVCRLSLR